MLTWLDKWCEGMRFRRIELLTEIGRPKDKFCRSDGLAAREAVLEALSASVALQERHEELPLSIAFMSMLAPFFVTPRGGVAVRAYQLTGGLADRLEDVELTPAMVNRTRDMVGLDWAIYIDVPSGVIQIGTGAELRAIFIQPWTHEILSYGAVVAPRKQYSWRHALWTDDRSQFAVDNVRQEKGSPAEIGMPTFDEFLQQADWTMERFQDEAERLAYLVLEYARDHAGAVAEHVPYLPADHERRIPGRGGDVADRFSLFKIVRLRPRNEGQANPEQRSERRPWRLGRRITVRPHWRRIRVPGTDKQRRVHVRAHQKGPADALPVNPLLRV